MKSPVFHKNSDRIALSYRDRTLVAGIAHRIAEGGDASSLDNVACSKSTAHRIAQAVRKDTADNIKANFVPPKFPALHVDGRQIKDGKLTH